MEWANHRLTGVAQYLQMTLYLVYYTHTLLLYLRFKTDLLFVVAGEGEGSVKFEFG
jgi:hypothetical protein